MAFFKIGSVDFSQYVRSLEVTDKAVYNSQTNAAGNTVVDYINNKRTIKVRIITLSAADMLTIQNALSGLSVSISFLNPKTNQLASNVACILPSQSFSYYTIQTDKTLIREIELEFQEL